MKTRLFIYAIISLALFSFVKPSGNSNGQCTKASCSKEFQTIAVTVPVKGFINNYQTVRVDDGQVINLTPAPKMAEGSYPLFTDAEIDLTNNVGKEFYFVGFYYKLEVLREKYTIARKDGHVVLLKGNTTIKIKEGC